MEHLFEAIDFVENPLYEKIISDIAKQQFSVINDFFSYDEVNLLRESLIQRHVEDGFKKAAIGNRLNENIEKSIRGDLILWMDEAKANDNEKLFFNVNST